MDQKNNLKKVWIVEDDEGISEITSLILDDNGYESDAIKNVDQLFAKLEKEMPDLILLDIFLYNANGIDIAKKIKAGEKTKHIPIIIMSADTQIEMKIKDTGVDDFLKKPFELNEFISKIEKFLVKEPEMLIAA